MKQPSETLDRASARRIALEAQGFSDPTPTGRVDIRHFRRVLNRIGILQLDSVQAVCRSHYLPVYSRLGDYRRSSLDRWLWNSDEVFETWAHEASVVLAQTEPFLRWKKARAEHGDTWGHLRALANEQPDYVSKILAEVAIRGPMKASHLFDPRPRSGTSWGARSSGQLALDWLFRTGRVGVRRDQSFRRIYELFENVVSEAIRQVASPSEADAKRSLLQIASRSLGIGTAADIADYFRIRLSEARPLLEDLVRNGKLSHCSVEGWPTIAYRSPTAKVPKQMSSRALLSPFDPLVWFRPRAERLFGFHYRIEIYVPAEKRKFGYYVLPFLLGDCLVGRVDLRADRSAGQLNVEGVFAEEGVDHCQVAGHLSEELDRLARFLELDQVVVGRRGSLASALRKVRS